MQEIRKETIVILPALNEEASLGGVLADLARYCPGMDIAVVNDGSSDRTGEVARAGGAMVIDLPCNLGIGGAVQAGLMYAYAGGYRYVVRCDADGQHPPAEIPKLLTALDHGGVDLAIGSRFAGVRSYTSTFGRHLGIRALALMLSVICRSWITDPTSGFFAMNRKLMHYFAGHYPTDYPEPEALAFLRRQGYDFCEVPVVFRPRQAGHSSIRTWNTLYYAFKVGLALVVDRARPVDPRFAKANYRGWA